MIHLFLPNETMNHDFEKDFDYQNPVKFSRAGALQISFVRFGKSMIREQCDTQFLILIHRQF